MKIKTSILQDGYTGQYTPLDETAPMETLLRQGRDLKEAVLAPQLALARKALESEVHLLVFREDCNGAGNYVHRVDRTDFLEALAETIPGPTTECLGELARTGNCYVVAGVYEKLDGRFYNTGVLIDPAGKVAGKYHKVQLPPLERLTLTPGRTFPVFQTEIGRIGIEICYDMMTPEITRCLALNGADVLCWPSLGYGWWEEAGDFTVRSRAHDNQVYILGALPANSCIVDPFGDILVTARHETTTVISAEIEPGLEPIQDPLHHNSYITQTNSLRERHLFERQPELYQVLVDPHPPLTERYPDTHMYDLEQDRLAAFERYNQARPRLTWQSSPDRKTIP